MAAVYGKVDKFDSKNQTWEDYIEVMGHYFIANEITTAGKQRAILLASVGENTYALIKSICQPVAPGDKTFEQLVKLVQDHHIPKPSEIVQRYKFHTRDRKDGETVHQFVAELRSLSKYCNFGDNLSVMLRDRLVVGVNDEQIQKKLLNETTLSFEKAMGIAVSTETTRKNIDALQKSNPIMVGASSSTLVNKMDPGPRGRGQQYKGDQPQRGKGATERGCYRCGGPHSSDKCSFKNEKCFCCKKQGHIKAMCRSKPKFFNLVEEGEEEDSDSGLTVYHVGNNKEPPIKITVEMEGKPAQFELDTGCPVTMVSKTFLDDWRKGEMPKLKPYTTKLKTYTGEYLRVLGTWETEIKYKENIKYVSVVVVAGSGPNLIGRDLISELSIISVNLVTTRQNNDLETILAAHPDVFKEGLGTLRGTKATIHVKPESTPRFFRPRSLPYAMKSKVEAELGRLVKEGILKPIKFSQWAAPIVPVLKPDGSLRLCGDYKVTVNQVSQLEQYPLPSLEDILTKLAGGQKFSKLDLSHAYQQLVLDEESTKYVTINTHQGLFTYTRLPFGVSSAPAIFQRTMENILQGIPKVAVYIDDILITGCSDEEHLRTLEQVLSKLEEAGLRLKKEKCVLMAESVRYLGHVVDELGIHPVQDKVQALKEARAPTNVSELKSYLGLLNYYHRFLPNLSTVLAPIHKLLRGGEPWKWEEAEQSSFEESKQLIMSAEVLVHYDTEKELILQCDASSYGVGAVLSHRMEDGTDQPIGFASRTLNVAERNYSQLDREGLSVMFGIKKFHKYLYGRSFIIHTDHKPLVSLFNEKKQVPVTASPRVQRWAVTLRGYEYIIQYRAGQEHGNADAFSRLPLPVTQSVEPTDRVLLVQEVQGFPVTTEQLRVWTERDPVLAHVKEYLLRGWPDDGEATTDPNLTTYKSKRLELSLQGGCVLWGARVVIPPPGRKQVLQELHQAHPGINRMKGLARSYVWWPSMDKDIEGVVQKCVLCQVHRKLPAVAPLHPWEWPDQPWKRVHMDYAGPFMGKMWLIIVDSHSKWIEVEIMNSTTSTVTINKLRSIFARHGVPEVMVSDNASNFTSQEMEEFFTKNGITHITSAPYHPSTNGLAERAVQTIKEGLRKISGENLETKLQRVLFNYRITPQTTTGKSPAEMLMGRKLRCRLDMLHPNLQSKIQLKQLKMKGVHDQHAKLRKFTEGDPVYVKNFGPGPKWIPGVIQGATGPVSYRVVLGDGRIQRRHVDHVRNKVEDQVDGPQPLEEPVPSQDAVIVVSRPANEIPDVQFFPQENQVPSETGQDGGTTLLQPVEGAANPETENYRQPAERYPERERRPPAYFQNLETIVE